MALNCCLAGINREMVQTLSEIFRAVGAPLTVVLSELSVSELGKLRPDMLVCDIDHLAVDPLEMLRQIRFVLPDCTIAVLTGVFGHAWSRACHLAGANCLLAKTSSAASLSAGIKEAFGSGCYTDPAFTDEAPATLTI